ncbi:protein kinase [Streptomyces sp. NPDC059002]|uniref:protein kinase domain-containing protein n=1 Tax=Streptomyces sp. NPDC059002 TaxID=3346690 RepID=UPI0036C0EFE7
MSSQDGAQGRYAGRSLAGGRYQLRDLLGEGGMASVHLAYDSVLDRQVAIKTLHTELGREQSFRERFRREAQSVAKLTHTNIVSVFDTGEDDLDGTTMPYIVMEYVEGKPLGSVLDASVAQYGAMPTDQALKITADVLAALEISHEMGLVHRDIKPGNVMMTKRNVVKVMDFGIARAMQSGVTSMTQTGMVVGTPQYLSPEQALGRGVDARSDLYSVGIMLFQLVTGRLPFEADSPLAIAYAHVQEEPVAPSSINRSLPPAVDAIVARALKKNPNERFPTAESMRDECLRVAQSFQASLSQAPSIVPGAQTASGAGVGSAVFPPVDTSLPQGGQVQTPYQPGSYGPPTPAPTPTPGYGYPQQGYQTPPPTNAYAPQQAAQTPPPYNLAPQPAPAAAASGPGRSGKRNMPVIVGSIVVALLAIGGLVVALQLGGDGDKEGSDDKSKQPVAGHKGPDRTKTMETTECTDPETGYNDENKIKAPDFTFKDWKSVLSCLQAAGWSYDKRKIDENAYGEDTVMRQTPKEGSEIDPKNVEIQFDVSSGDPA